MNETNLIKNGKPVYCIHGYLVSWEERLRPQPVGTPTPPKKVWGWHISSKRFWTLYPHREPRFGWDKVEGVKDFIQTAIDHNLVFSNH